MHLCPSKSLRPRGGTCEPNIHEKPGLARLLISVVVARVYLDQPCPGAYGLSLSYSRVPSIGAHRSITPERTRRVKDLFAAARARPPAERASFLDAVGGGDASLRAEGDGAAVWSLGMNRSRWAGRRRVHSAKVCTRISVASRRCAPGVPRTA
jgi:hypothetical protein